MGFGELMGANDIIKDIQNSRLATYNIRFGIRREDLKVPTYYTKEQLIERFQIRAIKLLELYPDIEDVRLYGIGHYLTRVSRYSLWITKVKFDERLKPCKICGRKSYHLPTCDLSGSVDGYQAIVEEYRKKYKEK